jgi:hypothetical protein
MAEWLPTVTYDGYRPGLPDIVLGRLPESLSISVGRAYKGWIVENSQEMAALQAALQQPIPQPEPGRLSFKSGPDAACSSHSEGAVYVALYPPPSNGWPWVVLAAWPRDAMQRTKIQRQRYTWETYNLERDATEAMEPLRLSLGGLVHFPGRHP